MKYMKLCILLLLGLFQSNLFGQNLVVQATRTNVLYIGLDNELLIRYKGVKDGDLMVKANNGTIIHVKDATYIATVHAGAKTCKIYIGLKKEKGRKWLDSMEMPIIIVPKPKARFGDIERGGATVADLLKQDSINCRMWETYIKGINIRITKYRIISMPKHGEMKEFGQKGAKISDEVKKEIEGLKDGDLIVVDGIRADGPGYRDKPIESIVIVISNDNFLWGDPSGRISGYYRDSNILRRYQYPILQNQKEVSEHLKKDSIWTYWHRSYHNYKMMKTRVDSFSNGHLCHSTYFSDTAEIKTYELKALSDTTFIYTSYYTNGKIYQKGMIRKHSRWVQYRKYDYYGENSYPDEKDIWDLCLSATPKYLYPSGQWVMYDTSGRLQLEVTYGFIKDEPMANLHNKDTWLGWTFLYIVPQGPCIIYEKGKVKETIIFKDGKIESRK